MSKKPQSPGKTGESDTSLKIVVLMAGAVLMSLEIVGSRLLAPHFGNSVYVWGSLISVFLVALSLGYWLGGHLADRKPTAGMLAILCIAVAALIFIIPWIGHPLCQRLESAGLGEQTGPLAAASILFLPASFLLGMFSPFSVRLTATAVQSVGRTAGSLYAVSTIGSILGTLGTTFLLIPYVGVSWILKCLAAVMVLLPLALIGRTGVKRSTVIGVLLVGFLGMSAHASPSFWLAHGATMQMDEDTPYHHLSVVDVGDRERYLQFDKYVESSISLKSPYPSTSDYTNYFNLAFLLNPGIGRSLFIGAGGGIGPRAFSAMNPSMDIDVVDIDRRVLDIAENYFFMPRSERIHTTAIDGRMFFRHSTGTYDCVVLDAYTIGGRIPFHLTTKEYFELIRSRMNSNGIFMMNVSSSLAGGKGGIYRSIRRTLGEVFGDVQVFAHGISRNHDRNILRNLVFVAALQPGTITRERLLSGVASYPERSTVTRQMLGPMIANLVSDPPGTEGTAPLTDDLAPIETMSF